ncbi:MAG: ATPase [Wenzhouxiangellaceae bacterium]
MSSNQPTTEVWLWWSSGKDSAWCLYLLQQSPDYQVTRLLTTVNRAAGRVAMHGVRESLLRAQADAAGVPLTVIDLPYPCTNEEYQRRLQPILKAAAEQGVTMAFGDLLLEDVRDYRLALLAPHGIPSLFPLWGSDTRKLAQTMCANGLRARLSCIDPQHLPPELAGAEFDQRLLDALPETIDACGENGEFHTFTYAGPMFSQSIAVTAGEVVERDGFVFCDLIAAAE